MSCRPCHCPRCSISCPILAIDIVLHRIPHPPVLMLSGLSSHSTSLMPMGCSMRSLSRSSMLRPVAFRTSAASINDVIVSYSMRLPGIACGCIASHACIQCVLVSRMAVATGMPLVMVSRCRTVMASSSLLREHGAWSSSKSITRSSRRSLPSSIANPTARPVSNLQAEYWLCGSLARKGSACASASTRPSRMTTRWCNSV